MRLLLSRQNAHVTQWKVHNWTITQFTPKTQPSVWSLIPFCSRPAVGLTPSWIVDKDPLLENYV